MDSSTRLAIAVLKDTIDEVSDVLHVNNHANDPLLRVVIENINRALSLIESDNETELDFG